MRTIREGYESLSIDMVSFEFQQVPVCELKLTIFKKFCQKSSK